MNKLIGKAALGVALVASATLAAAPAEARDYYRYGRHHDRTGTAIAAGVVGLAIGAALASNSRGRYYDDGYYDDYRYRGGYYPQSYYYPRYRTYYYYDNYRPYRRHHRDRYDRYDRRYYRGY